MTTDPGVAIRPLEVADARACDEVIRSLPYHFGDPDGRRECAEAVRASDGLVAVRDGQVIGFLTVAHHFEAVSEITLDGGARPPPRPGHRPGPRRAAHRPAPGRGAAAAPGPDRLVAGGGAGRGRRLPAD